MTWVVCGLAVGVLAGLFGWCAGEGYRRWAVRELRVPKHAYWGTYKFVGLCVGVFVVIVFCVLTWWMFGLGRSSLDGWADGGSLLIISLVVYLVTIVCLFVCVFCMVLSDRMRLVFIVVGTFALLGWSLAGVMIPYSDSEREVAAQTLSVDYGLRVVDGFPANTQFGVPVSVRVAVLTENGDEFHDCLVTLSDVAPSDMKVECEGKVLTSYS